MYRFTFPRNPTLNQEHISGEFAWRWNGSRWVSIPSPNTGGTGGNGAQGATGSTGAQGATGTGAQGVSGTAVAQGAQGTQGLQGLQGIQGEKGSQGTQGLQGLVGVQGTQGLQGVQGTAIQGTQGLTGTQGSQGLQGTQGLQGLQGVQGPGSGLYLGTTTPVNPQPNTFWWNESTGALLIYYNDGTSTQWVEVSTPGIQGATGGGTSTSKFVRGATFVNSTGSALNTPVAPVYLHFPTAGNISNVSILTTGGTGSCVVDIWQDTFANYPPTVSKSLTASAKPTISSGIKYSDSIMTGWNKTINSGNVLAINLDSTSTFNVVSVYLEITQ